MNNLLLLASYSILGTVIINENSEDCFNKAKNVLLKSNILIFIV